MNDNLAWVIIVSVCVLSFASCSAVETITNERQHEFEVSHGLVRDTWGNLKPAAAR